MKILTITCHHAFNYGAMLQAYALTSYLSSLGHDVHVIDYAPYYLSGKVEVNFRWVPAQYDFWGIKQLYRIAKRKERSFDQIRKNALEQFYKMYIPATTERYNSIDDLRSASPKADMFIAGSDQIWNTRFPNGTDAAFYLDFGSPKRKISYAASFATQELVDGSQAFVSDKLRNFDAISVRESSGLGILRDLGLSGTQVVDPVFLIDNKGWDVFDKDSRARERYILTYDFEKRHSVIASIAKRLAHLQNCKIYSVSPFRLSYVDKSFPDAGPGALVSLIKHAQCVISNSFHGSAFSMIYRKNFFVVNRSDGLNVRMSDLLGRYGLSDRIITPLASDEDLMRIINYDKAMGSLNMDIKKSKDFLQSQINLAQ